MPEFSPALHANHCPALPSLYYLLLNCIPGCSLPFAFLLLHCAQTLGSRNRNIGWITNKPGGCSRALARRDPYLCQQRKAWSRCSPPALCRTHGVNQPPTEMSIKTAFLTVRLLLSVAFGVGETAHQTPRVLFPPQVMQHNRLP